MKGNAFAWVVLFGWPIVVFLFFAMRRSTHRVARTTAWMMFVSVMLLPSSVEYDPPGLPSLDKHRIAFVCIAIALQLFHRQQLLGRVRGHNFPRLVFLVMVYGAVQTAATNADALTFGRKTLPGLTSYDALSLSMGLLLDCYLPFVVGQRVFRSERDLRDLFEVMRTCALVYAPLILLEWRLSPQLHNWVYGFHPSEFIQAMRGDGFRPVVFMNHGLSVAMWVFSCLCATLALERVGARTLFIWVELVLCRSMAPTLYAGLATLLGWLTRPRVSAAVIVAVVFVVTLYPITRATGSFPADDVLEFFRGIDSERAASLEFRMQNEDALLERASVRPTYGWGGFGRNRIWAEWGQDVSVTDGYWIIMLGTLGYVGWGAFFALLVFPLLRYVWHFREMPASSRAMMSVFALMMALFTLDLLPNARSDFLSIAYAGMLWTLSERLSQKVPRQASLARAPTASTLPPREVAVQRQAPA
ncbi:MAG: hypothetical protein L0Y64_01655 [Myxococcaceae bacterium]|nr:hypothetical protein [Myxococcaceae bacterium]